MMFPKVVVLAVTLLLCLSTALPQRTAHNTEDLSYTFNPPRLNLTTIAGNGRHQSVIECWSVADLAVSSTPGTDGALFADIGKPSTASYLNIPAQFNGGLHNAPAVQWVGPVSCPWFPFT